MTVPLTATPLGWYFDKNFTRLASCIVFNFKNLKRIIGTIIFINIAAYNEGDIASFRVFNFKKFERIIGTIIFIKFAAYN